MWTRSTFWYFFSNCHFTLGHGVATVFALVHPRDSLRQWHTRGKYLLSENEWILDKIDYPENSLRCAPLHTFTISPDQHIASLKAWMRFKATDKVRFALWRRGSPGELGCGLGGVVHGAHLMAFSKWNTSLKKKLLVCGVITLTCLPFVSRKSPVVGYVSLIKEGTVGKMAALNWKPFVYGGLASITAECGKEPKGMTYIACLLHGMSKKS